VKSNSDIDAAICYYCFINHGTLPHEILSRPPRERAFIYAMMKQEVKVRENLKKKA